MKPSAILFSCGAATLAVVALVELRPSPINAASTYKVKNLAVFGPYLLPGEDIGGLPPVILTEERDEPVAVEQGPVTFTEVPPSSGRRGPRPTNVPFTPPGLQDVDAQVAASDGYLILATGSRMLFYGKDGHPLESKLTGKVIGAITSDAFFGNAQMQQDIRNNLNLPAKYASLTDPSYIDLRVRFDHYRKRFWVISEWTNKTAYKQLVNAGDPFAEYARRNKIVAGVSRTQDPRDGFWLYWWEGEPGDGACNALPDGTRLELCPGSEFAPGDAADFPYLGFSADHAIQTIHYNNIWPHVVNGGDAVVRGVVVNLLPADVMMAGDRVLAAWSYWDLKDHFGVKVDHRIVPADGHPLGDPANHGYLARLVRDPLVSDNASNLFLNYWSISNGSPPTLSSSVAPLVSLAIGDFGGLPQPGSTVVVPVFTAYHTVFRNGRLYFPFLELSPLVAGVDAKGNPINWTRVRFIGVGTASGAVEIDRTIDVFDSGAGTFTAKGFPELQVNKHGNIAVAYMAAGLPNVRQGAYYSVYYPASDELTGRRTLHAGDGIIANDDDVDHGGTALDPADNESIWMAHFYATGAGTYGYVVGKVFGTTLADLFSRGITLSTDAVNPGGEFTVRIRVRNQGDGHTIATRATVYLSADDEISGDDRALEEVTIPAIQAGDERVVELQVRLPPDVAEGAYSIGVDLDSDHRLREYLVDNNRSTRNPRLRVQR